MRTELRAARGANKCLLARIDFTLVYFRVKLQRLKSREALITLLAAIVAVKAGVHAKVSQLGELLRALIALVHSH